jgi:predicted NAD-dependent protein-ADP-ribosyltransferase YbiA (DUF1768 family)
VDSNLIQQKFSKNISVAESDQQGKSLNRREGRKLTMPWERLQVQVVSKTGTHPNDQVNQQLSEITGCLCMV